MSSVRFLDFQYNKSKFSKRLFSFSNKQYSNILPIYQPNEDEMSQVFNKFDRDKDGKISKEDYKATLGAIGKPEVVREVEKIFRYADENGDGFIDKRQFMALNGGVRTMDIRNAFRAFDVDQDGKISSEEVYKMLTSLGEICTLEDCRSMVTAVDLDGDGFVNMNEFINMMTKTMTRC